MAAVDLLSPLEGRVRRQNKKSVRWMRDPEILARINVVAHLMLEGHTAVEIQQGFPEPRPSYKTILRDIARVREYWRSRADEGLLDARAEAEAQYKKVIQEAWKQVFAQPERADRFLNVVLNAQGNLDKIKGSADEPEAGKLVVEHHINIEQVRRQRWLEVADALQGTVIDSRFAETEGG